MMRPSRPKICSGLRGVAEQELHRQQVQHDPDRARQSVIGSPVPARPVIHHAFGDLHALFARDRRQEAVHLAVQLQRLDDLGAEHFQRTPVVVQLDARREGDDGIGDHRREPAVQERVLPVLPPSCGDVGALLDQLDQGGQVRRVVLQIAVGRGNQRAAGVVESGRERCCLSKVAAEPDDAPPRVFRLTLRQQLETVVGAPIVHRDDLVRTSPRLEGAGQLPIESGNARGLVADGNDDGEIRCGHHEWRWSRGLARTGL